MQIMKRTALIVGCTFGFAGIACAETGTGPESAMGVGGLFQPSGIWSMVDGMSDGIVMRRGRGADDGADHDAGDDHGNHGAGHTMLAPVGSEWILLAKKGSDDGPDHDAGDDHGGHSGRDGGGDDGTPDQGSGSGGDDSSGSGRSKPRIPGGSGCDDAGDVAEHAECQV